MKKNNSTTGFGIAGFILGLLSVLLFWFYIIGPLLGIVGLIFSIIQIKKNKTKLSIAGLILSIIGIILGVFMIIALVAFWNIIETSVNSGSLGIESSMEEMAKLG